MNEHQGVPPLSALRQFGSRPDNLLRRSVLVVKPLVERWHAAGTSGQETNLLASIMLNVRFPVAIAITGIANEAAHGWLPISGDSPFVSLLGLTSAARSNIREL